MRAHSTTTAAAMAAACALVLGGCLPSSSLAPAPTAGADRADTVTVTRVVDGDTLIVTPPGRGPVRCA